MDSDNITASNVRDGKGALLHGGKGRQKYHDSPSGGALSDRNSGSAGIVLSMGRSDFEGERESDSDSNVQRQRSGAR